MKVVVTADVQLHNHKQNHWVTKRGLNSRFVTGLASLRQAAKAAEGGVLVINGDLFDHRKVLEIDVLHHTFEMMRAIASQLKYVVIVVGNHDQYLKGGEVHSTKIFEAFDNVLVVDKSATIRLPHIPFALHCHAYTESLDDVKKFIAEVAEDPTPPAGALFIHQSIFGASMGHSICEDKGLTLEDLHAESFNYVFAGHFHEPQQLAPNVCYVGSPYQVNRSEAGDEKRFMVWDSEQGWHSVPVVGLPRYFSFNGVGEYKQALSTSKCTADDFVDLTVPKEKFEQVSEVLGGNPRFNLIAESEQAQAYEGPALTELSVSSAILHCLEEAGRMDLKDLALTIVEESGK